MPRIKTTPMVKAALWALRIYLLVLLSLIVLKFARVFSSAAKQDTSTQGVPSIATNQPLNESSGSLK
jgi:hypothetical protein